MKQTTRTDYFRENVEVVLAGVEASDLVRDLVVHLQQILDLLLEVENLLRKLLNIGIQFVGLPHQQNSCKNQHCAVLWRE